MKKILYKLYYETYSYYGDAPTELQLQSSDDFSLEGGELLGIYSSYHIALQRKESFSNVCYISNFKRLNIYEFILDDSEWQEGFTTL